MMIQEDALPCSINVVKLCWERQRKRPRDPDPVLVDLSIPSDQMHYQYLLKSGSSYHMPWSRIGFKIFKGMKDRIRIELLPIILPLSMGRTSERPPERTSRQQSRTRPLSATRTSSLALIALTKLSISREFRRFIRTLKSLPQLFVYKDDEMETEEVEMDIGFPTDVKHLTHIGFDGSTSTKKNYMRKSWEDSSTPEIIHFPSVSLRQFELAMASQADSRSQ
ncbi:CRIB domain-containing protein [Dionaea muscipula]